MLHRRLLHDDQFGVGEPLNETAFGQGLVVRGKHKIIIESPSSSAIMHRVSAQQFFMHPLATFSLVQQTFTDYSASYYLTWSALTDTLPLNLHLLTFDQLGTKNYLVRIENYFELNEDYIYSKPVTFDLQSIFQSIGTINNATELTLTANLPLSELQRLNWMPASEKLNKIKDSRTFNKEYPNKIFSYFLDKVPLQATIVTLNPMQIRTFDVTVS